MLFFSKEKIEEKKIAFLHPPTSPAPPLTSKYVRTAHVLQCVSAKLLLSDTGRIEAEREREKNKRSGILFVAQCNYVGWILAQREVVVVVVVVGRRGVLLEWIRGSTRGFSVHDSTLAEARLLLVFLQPHKKTKTN